MSRIVWLDCTVSGEGNVFFCDHECMDTVSSKWHLDDNACTNGIAVRTRWAL